VTNQLAGEAFLIGFGACDMYRLVHSIHAKTGIKIAGIIGSDMMKKYKFKIDYAEKKIYCRFE